MTSVRWRKRRRDSTNDKETNVNRTENSTVRVDIMIRSILLSKIGMQSRKWIHLVLLTLLIGYWEFSYGHSYLSSSSAYCSVVGEADVSKRKKSTIEWWKTIEGTTIKCNSKHFIIRRCSTNSNTDNKFLLCSQEAGIQRRIQAQWEDIKKSHNTIKEIKASRGNSAHQAFHLHEI